MNSELGPRIKLLQLCSGRWFERSWFKRVEKSWHVWDGWIWRWFFEIFEMFLDILSGWPLWAVGTVSKCYSIYAPPSGQMWVVACPGPSWEYWGVCLCMNWFNWWAEAYHILAAFFGDKSPPKKTTMAGPRRHLTHALTGLDLKKAG